MDVAFESPYWKKFQYICGVDEVGRGPLAGPVVAAAVIFDRYFEPSGILEQIDDSKALRHETRVLLSSEIKKQALSFSIAEISPEVIDEVNILQATFLAMNQAIEQLSPIPEFLLIDGNRFKTTLPIPFETVVKGDSKVFSIAAASIIAKVHRDNFMINLAERYPEYGFAQHFGYPTKAHIEAIKMFGRSKVHRKSFKLSCLGEK
ncbi:Ribonuclease H [Chloroherpeton thalassium ATCC 35110]|uniref:Ribonuclease HII n=1 Tax=Chloroherpeton thalassium (strain ATCC 35110 / GB-78) TaxID=517418 RepID=RNH2_CHLT3|nr:ribonuclease HII [Chloroherpeton thalassium]B3QRP3.1 RecName: Full=Ribonuclease HII; Short=RNase HII [Chloroherpeton thalassium ATCC 35110]ACF13846.1 Ribonuclease H [Chloroherpeton thalassium ATCC 35110]